MMVILDYAAQSLSLTGLPSVLSDLGISEDTALEILTAPDDETLGLLLSRIELDFGYWKMHFTCYIEKVISAQYHNGETHTTGGDAKSDFTIQLSWESTIDYCAASSKSFTSYTYNNSTDDLLLAVFRYADLRRRKTKAFILKGPDHTNVDLTVEDDIDSEVCFKAKLYSTYSTKPESYTLEVRTLNASYDKTEMFRHIMKKQSSFLYRIFSFFS